MLAGSMAANIHVCFVCVVFCPYGVVLGILGLRLRANEITAYIVNFFVKEKGQTETRVSPDKLTVWIVNNHEALVFC